MKTKPATMADVGKLAGVSPMTVSRALKPNTSVSLKTREKIQKAADSLGYVLDSNAAGFSSRRTGFVAVTIPSIDNGNFADTLSGLTEGITKSGLQVLLGYTNYDVLEEERLVEQLLKRRPEAIVVTGGTHTDRCRQLLENAAIPVIEMWDIPNSPIDSVVGFSNAYASELMVTHFIDCGYERIGFLGSDQNRDTRGSDRFRGFSAALKNKGLDHERVIFSSSMPVSMREGAEGISQLLKRWPDTQAVMCVSDPCAFGAMTECQRLGMIVPDDIAIAGFGAYGLSEFAIPAITTVDVDARGLGESTADNLVRLLNGDDQYGLMNTSKPKLIIRDSSQR